MKHVISLVFAVVASSSLISGTAAQCEKTQFVCYYGSWAKYRLGPAKFTVEDIDPFVCTHIVYTFIGLDDSTGNVIYLDPYLDLSDEWHKGALDLLLNLRAQNPNLKLQVAVGGWNEGSEKYSRVCKDPAKRRNFVKSAIDFVEKHQLDGFDLDWEYPTQRGGASEDRNSFSLLVKELRAEANSRGRSDIILSAAVTANALTIGPTYDVAEISKHLDFINVMAYDLHGSWEKKANHHAALNPHACEDSSEQHLNLKSAMKSWVDNGAPRCKLNLGLPSYGRSFELAAPSSSCEVCTAAIGPYQPGNYVGESGFLPYSEICRNILEKSWKVCNSPSQEVPFIVNGKLWVGYDDPASLINKVNWAKSEGFGGVMLWSIETDDNLGLCQLGRFPLCNAIKNAWFSDGVLPTNPPTLPPTTTTTQAPTTGGPTNPPTEPPITGTQGTPPPSNGVCNKGSTFVRDPNNCNVFYYCVSNGSTYQENRMVCPPGLVFDLKSNICNYLSEVPECA